MSLLLSLFCSLFLPGLAAATPFAKVAELKGLASLEPMHTNLKVGMQLSEGDRITVMSNSMLRLKLDNGIALQIGSHSDLVLKHGKGKMPIIRVAHGRILAVVKPPEPADPLQRSRLEIRTGQTTLSVYGADFFAKHEGDTTFLCTCSGAVKAHWGKNDALMHGLDHNHPVKIVPHLNKPQATKEKGPDHSDEDIAALKKLL